MSVVTNVILTIGPNDNEEKLMVFLNHHLASCDIGDIPFRALPVNVVTGSKNLEQIVCVGAFNHLDMNGLIQALQAFKWPAPDSVALFVCEQDENRFSERRLFAPAGDSAE